MRHEIASPLPSRGEGRDGREGFGQGEGAERPNGAACSRARPLFFVAALLVISTSAFADSTVLGRSQLGGAGLQLIRSAEVAPHSLGVGADVGFFRAASLTQTGG